MRAKRRLLSSEDRPDDDSNTTLSAMGRALPSMFGGF